MRSLAIAIAWVGLATAGVARAQDAGAVEPPSPAPVVALQPLGDAIPEGDVTAVAQALRAMYGVEARVLPRAALPKSAWYPPRRRWRAERILDVLEAQRPAEAVRILGLTAADISTTKDAFVDWGILGLGNLSGTAGVLSTFRCKMKARDAAQARERFAKVAVHEYGHTLGLEHCVSPGCLMRDAEGKVKSTDEEGDLCPACRAKLRAKGWVLPEPPTLPWAQPRAPWGPQ
jgi:archaemetzincin